MQRLSVLCATDDTMRRCFACQTMYITGVTIGMAPDRAANRSRDTFHKSIATMPAGLS